MSDQPHVYQLRTIPKDLGVAIVWLLALGLGLLLFLQVNGRTISFRSTENPFSIAYPAGWIESPLLQDVLLQVEDPQTPSAFKTTMTVDVRELDPQSVPTLQTLLDRRVEDRSTLDSYHFFGNNEATVAGEKAMQLDYAYVVQPIDEPRRASLPVVVRAREYIVLTADRLYYITLAAPATEFDQASEQFDRTLKTIQFS